MVLESPQKALSLAAQSQLPRLQEFTPRRLLGGKTATNSRKPPKSNMAKWQRIVGSRHPSSPLMALESEESFVSIAFGTKLPPVPIRSKEESPRFLAES